MLVRTVDGRETAEILADAVRVQFNLEEDDVSYRVFGTGLGVMLNRQVGVMEQRQIAWWAAGFCSGLAVGEGG